MSKSDKVTIKKVSCLRTAFLLALFFSLSFFGMEMVFKYSVSAVRPDISVLYLLAFSVFTGSAFAFLLCVLPSVISRILAPLILLAACVVFLIELFIQREFGVFYDINTILNAATDALRGFGGDIRSLVFSADGIMHVILFVFPLILWAVFGRKLTRSFGYAKGPGKYTAGLAAAGVSLLALSAILISISAGVWNKESFGRRYSFQNSVASYGLGCTAALDLWHRGNAVEEEPEFVIVDELPYDEPVPVYEPDVTASLPEEPSTEVSPEPVVYGVNAYDIDYAALAQTGPYKNLNAYVASLTPSSQNRYTGLFRGKNLILICAEAFSGFIIDPELTPALYRLTTKGINFNDYYEQATAGTTGGEFQLIFGLMPMAGGDSMLTMTAQGSYTNMGAMLGADDGYYGMAFHDNDDLYYSRNITHNLLGYSEGFMGFGNGMEKLISRAWPESDCEMIQGTLPLYAEHQPFNIYYMTVSGHSRYDFHSNAMSVRNKEVVEKWCEEKGLDYSDPVKAYIACNMELEYMLEYLLEYLEENGLEDDTVIAMAPDHFPYGLTDGRYLGNLPYLDELYGYKVETQLDRDRNKAIIWCGVLEDEDPIIIDKPTSPLDILPTLLNLFGCEWDSRLYIGRDVLSNAEGLYFDSGYNWKTEVGTYRAATGVFTPNPGYEEVGEAYIRRHNAIVANKIAFNRNVIYNSYYPYIYSLVEAQHQAEEDKPADDADPAETDASVTD